MRAGGGSRLSVLLGAPSLCLHTRSLPGRLWFHDVTGRDTAGAHGLLWVRRRAAAALSQRQ